MRVKFGKLPFGVFYSMRPFQWVKNLAVFAAVIFNGKLFDQQLLLRSFWAFIAFCLFSSASYLINDIVDAPYDRRHPLKKNRPIARGDVSPSEAKIAAVILLILGIEIASFLDWRFVALLLLFFLLHLLYSFYLKKFAVIDILAISFSFILRALAGEVATGYHLSVWLTFTVVFLSLFIASGKRRSELLVEGAKTRPALVKYQKGLLNFYTSVFAVATLLSYSLFSYFFQAPNFGHSRTREFLIKNMPHLIGRKWLMLSIFPVIFGIMRFSQLVFERQEGEKPESLLITDIPLSLSVLSWGLMIVLFVYVF